ncbi:GNAT family N-acetyltransferase [Vibrio japonicus]|uniref:GNAT family N-acetyltransferase n=1 Tax=Vibrio japonicus TaxID=1824638 RepID=A0ABY5LKZ8_9VIBR|nr:GNAT family protein [Vibrio japonicus]UUM31795.1 GNAT family N-acetyltransferase [Vibrio japonicus]
MLTIEKLTRADIERVKSLSVDDSQLKYVGTTEEILNNLNGSCIPHIIKQDCAIVGFFLLDFNYSESYEFVKENSSIGLRAYLIDAKQQGNGYGVKAVMLLPDYVKSHFPDVSKIYLTVNCKNPIAQNCYVKAGFIDNGDLYLGGAAGPQHIMFLNLR